ncbi:MAG TPA: hypothetical protein VM032_03800 [Vicinamibacterales bacterium]|nr:hypothetical protein [Vicinamibacterales bacterium]
MTRHRAIAAVIATVTIVVAVWLGRNLYWADTEVPASPRGEARTNPFYASLQFTRSLGAHGSWDRVFSLPPADGVLVLADWRWGLSRSLEHAMESWVEGGGRLVVDRSIVDDSAFERWSQIGAVTLAARGPAVQRAAPITGCRPVAAAGQAQVAAGLPSQVVLCDALTRSHLAVPDHADWILGDRLGAQVVRVPVGRGSVTAINARPFTGQGLFEGEHAVLFVAAAQLRTGDQVRFLSAGDYPTLLELAWRTGSPVVMLAIAVLAAWLWRTAARFGPQVAIEPNARRSLEEQIRGTGEFARRYGAGRPLLAATLRALEETARRRIAGYGRMAPDDRVAALAAASGIGRDDLAAAMVTTAGHGHRLGEAIRTMEVARRQLLTSGTRT